MDAAADGDVARPAPIRCRDGGRRGHSRVMTLPPTEAPPSKRRTARTMSSPRAAREPRSTKDAGRTTIRAERRGSRSQSSYSFILLSLSSHSLASLSRLVTLTSLPVVRRPIDTRRDAAAVVTTLRLRRAISAHEATKLSGAPPLLHVPPATRLPTPAGNQCRRRAGAMSSFCRVNRAEDGMIGPWGRDETPGSSRCESHQG